MNYEFWFKLLICFFCGALAFISVYNLCLYFHIDEREIVKRLIDIKDRTFKPVNKIENNFAAMRSNFRFNIFSKILKDIKLTEHIQKNLDRAGINWQVDTFLILCILSGTLPLILAIFIHPAIAILSPVGLLAPYIYIRITIKKRTELFTQQLPDALDLLCNALRAGHSLFSAFEIIVHEMPNPISGIFKVLTDEVTLGIDTKEAMRSLQETVPDSVDLKFFTTVVILQREIGGNLIKLLEILAGTIRERFKMAGQLKAQTAQAKLSGIIVSLVPPSVAVVLFFMAPDYMNYLFNHIWGQIALTISTVLMITGFVIINKITDIEI